jgi:hypothetical protein
MKKHHNRSNGTGDAGELTLEELEELRLAIAEIILVHGPVYGPYLDRIEKEIEAARSRENVVDRARRIREEHQQAIDQADSNKLLGPSRT